VFSKTFIVILFKPTAFSLLFVIPLQFDEGNFKKDEKFYKNQVAVNIKFCCTQQYSQFIPKKEGWKNLHQLKSPYIYLLVFCLISLVCLQITINWTVLFQDKPKKYQKHKTAFLQCILSGLYLYFTECTLCRNARATYIINPETASKFQKFSAVFTAARLSGIPRNTISWASINPSPPFPPQLQANINPFNAFAIHSGSQKSANVKRTSFFRIITVQRLAIGLWSLLLRVNLFSTALLRQEARRDFFMKTFAWRTVHLLLLSIEILQILVFLFADSILGSPSYGTLLSWCRCDREILPKTTDRFHSYHYVLSSKISVDRF